MTLPVPYPADTRAKGWRFEIDYEKVEQSDTWSLAAEVPMAQHALLMMWVIAWTQVPCGSMPNDVSLIRAKCRIPAKQWGALRPVLMRGWWVAEDGRLYHDTIVQRVLEMMKRRRSESDRKAAGRARNAADVRPSPANVPRDTHGTDAGLHPESSTGTGTGTGTSIQVDTPPNDLGADVGGVRASPSKAGSICQAIKAKGVQGVNPSNPELLALIERGVPTETFEAAAVICADAKPPKGMAYLLGIVKRQLGEAAAIASGVGLPTKPWDESKSTILAKAAELGMAPWNENDLSVKRETFPAYTERVRRAIENLEHA